MVRLLVVEFAVSPDVLGFAKHLERVADVRQAVAVDDAHHFSLDAGGSGGIATVGVLGVTILIVRDEAGGSCRGQYKKFIGQLRNS